MEGEGGGASPPPTGKGIGISNSISNTVTNGYQRAFEKKIISASELANLKSVEDIKLIVTLNST